MRAVTNSSRYRKFIAGRDRALEKILHTVRQRQTAILQAFAEEIRRNVVFYSANTPGKFDATEAGRVIHAAKNLAYLALYDTVRDARTAAFVLSTAAEAEALAIASGRPMQWKVSREDIKRVQAGELPAGGRIGARVGLYLDRLGRRILDSVQIGLTVGETPAELGDRVAQAMPRTKTYKAPPKIFRRLTEADALPKPDLSLGFIDDEAWEFLLSMYKEEHLPDRSSIVYDWELERDTTDDFVQAVADGQIQAAKENKITDFVWIAVIDDKTDECCLWRDGLLVSEIEEQLDGEHKDDECDATVPPAHPNCRCRIAPALENIDADLPTSTGKDFDEWLQS